jgi:Holliday junction DNA helicase RuvB
MVQVAEVAARLEIDEHGLWPVDRKILRLLVAARRPLGIDAIATTLRLDPNALRFLHEPYLAERGYLIRTPSGRMATDKAHGVCGNAA